MHVAIAIYQLLNTLCKSLIVGGTKFKSITGIICDGIGIKQE